MKTNALRALVAISVLAAFGAAGAGVVRAAEPTLGATVESRIFLDVARAIHVINRSTVSALVTATPTAGYTTDPVSMVLAPQQEGIFVVIGDAPDGTKIPITVTSAAPVAGARSAGSLDVTVMHYRPFDPTFWIMWAAIIFGSLVAGYSLYRWARANLEWQAPVARRPR